MRTWRYLVTGFAVGDDVLKIDYADLFIVERDDGSVEWESQARTPAPHVLSAAVHRLEITTPEGTLRGDALLRFTDGARHLFRGDGELLGPDGNPFDTNSDHDAP